MISKTNEEIIDDEKIIRNKNLDGTLITEKPGIS
jgi:hypothetical protein